MERQAFRNTVIATLGGVASKVGENDLASNRPLRLQGDLDSMNWLHFLIVLHQALQVDILESDYGRLHTLDDLLGYLSVRLQGRPAA